MVSFLGHRWNHSEELLVLSSSSLLLEIFDHFNQKLNLIIVQELIFVPFYGVFDMSNDELFVEVRLLPVYILEWHSLILLNL